MISGHWLAGSLDGAVHDWTLVEVAELLGVSPTTVQTHLRRALDRLQQELEVHHDD